jgi:hypothetical protein
MAVAEGFEVVGCDDTIESRVFLKYVRMGAAV